MSSTQETPDGQPLRYPRSLVDHAHYSKHNTNLLQQNHLAGDTYRQALPLPDCLAGDTYRQALSALIFTATTTIPWRDFLYHQAPRALVFTELHTSPGAPLLTARRHRDPKPPISTLSLGGSLRSTGFSLGSNTLHTGCSHSLSF